MGNYDDNDMIRPVHDPRVEPVRPMPELHQLGEQWQEFYDDHKAVQQRHSDDERYQQLVAAALLFQQKLTIAGSPYRFCVYKKSGEITVEMVRVDSKGRAIEESLTAVAPDELARWIEDFDSGEGLLFDRTG